MNERGEHDDAADDADEDTSSTGVLSRVKSVVTEAVGVVVDGVLDAL